MLAATVVEVLAVLVVDSPNSEAARVTPEPRLEVHRQLLAALHSNGACLHRSPPDASLGAADFTSHHHDAAKATPYTTSEQQEKSAVRN